MKSSDFYTFGEYMKKDNDVLTASMEDYLEMIYRLSSSAGYTRVHDLSIALNVQPPSVTKMIKKLSEINFVKYEKYNIITLTEQGKSRGEFLLKRHNIVEKFFQIIGIEEKLLEQTEKIEHTLENKTIMCMEKFVRFMDDNDDIKKRYEEYIK